MDLFGRNVTTYNVVAAMCKHRRAQSDMAVYKRSSAMTRIVERRAFNERLSLKFHGYNHRGWGEIVILCFLL